jgi:hypothetical protein
MNGLLQKSAFKGDRYERIGIRVSLPLIGYRVYIFRASIYACILIYAEQVEHVKITLTNFYYFFKSVFLRNLLGCRL